MTTETNQIGLNLLENWQGEELEAKPKPKPKKRKSGAKARKLAREAAAANPELDLGDDGWEKDEVPTIPEKSEKPDPVNELGDDIDDWDKQMAGALEARQERRAPKPKSFAAGHFGQVEVVTEVKQKRLERKPCWNHEDFQTLGTEPTNTMRRMDGEKNWGIARPWKSSATRKCKRRNTTADRADATIVCNEKLLLQTKG